MSRRMRGSFALVPEWAEVRITDGMAMRLYVRLARKYADRERHAFPGEDVLADELGCSERTIQRCVQALVTVDVLVVERERRADGSYGRNLYHLPTEDPRDAHQPPYLSPGQATDMAAGSDQHKQHVSAGKQDHPPAAKYGGSENQPDPSINQTAGAKAPDTDARASCPGPHAAAGNGGAARAEEDQQDTLFASWHGSDQDKSESQDHNGNGVRQGSQVKVKRSRRSSSRSGLTPEQSAAVQGATGEWVDTWRAVHGGIEPTAAKRGQAGREIRALIAAGNDPGRVLHAARSAARAGFATVEQQLARMSATSDGGRPGRVSATELPRDDWRRFVQE